MKNLNREEMREVLEIVFNDLVKKQCLSPENKESILNLAMAQIDEKCPDTLTKENLSSKGVINTLQMIMITSAAIIKTPGALMQLDPMLKLMKLLTSDRRDVDKDELKQEIALLLKQINALCPGFMQKAFNTTNEGDIAELIASKMLDQNSPTLANGPIGSATDNAFDLLLSLTLRAHFGGQDPRFPDSVVSSEVDPVPVVEFLDNGPNFTPFTVAGSFRAVEGPGDHSLAIAQALASGFAPSINEVSKELGAQGLALGTAPQLSPDH